MAKKKIDPKLYCAMSAKEQFVVLGSAMAREDFKEADRVLAALPTRDLKGLDPELLKLNLRALHLASFVLHLLQAAFGSYQSFRFAADALCIENGRIPFGYGQDEQALAQASDRLGEPNPIGESDLMILQLRDDQDEMGEEIGSILAAITALCNEEIGLTPTQLIASTVPYGKQSLEAVLALEDLSPATKRTKAHLKAFREVWEAGGNPPARF